MMGPKTIGGLMVATVKLGFSFSRKSQAAFSANVLLARYPWMGLSDACSSVIGFQSSSEYVCSGQNPLSALTMAAKDDVITTRLTVGALFLIDFKMPVVPIMAGSSRSCPLSVYIKAHCLKQSMGPVYLLDISDVEVERAGSMQNDLKRRIRYHSFVERIGIRD